MLFQELRIRNGAQRGPPQLRFESLCVDAIDQRFHVGVAVGKLLGVYAPIAIVVLPTIVQRDPGEAHLLDRWKRVVHLLELHRAAVTPRAPDRAKRAVGR